MTLTDTRLTDPIAAAVRAALRAAFGALAVRNAATRGQFPAGMAGAADRATTTPEGQEWWELLGRLPRRNDEDDEDQEEEEESEEPPEPPRRGRLSIAWWTAISGRRHVRVTGCFVTADTYYLLNETKLSTRPPVWHVFPDRVYRRRVGKANDLVVVCGCGAIGTEKALGWAGPCCGPCADYREEHGSLPWTRAAYFPTPTPCVAVAGSADGKWIAAAFAGGAEVRVWDIEAPDKPVFTWTTRFADISAAIALSPDGRYLALAGRANGRVNVSDLRAEPARTAIHTAVAEDVVFHPTSGALHIISDGTVLTAAPPGAPASLGRLPVASAEAPLVFSPDGSRFAVRRGQTVRVYESNGTERATLSLPRTTLYRPLHHDGEPIGTPRVAFSPDGAQVAIGYDQALAVYHAVTGERRYLDDQLDAEPTGVAFAPGGEWLYVGRQDGTLVAHHTATFAEERSVVFRWSLGPIRALAACGDSLLTACDEGVQVWPMAKLLEGL